VVDVEDTNDDVKKALLNRQTKDKDGKNRAIFLMATYGEGEPTDNASVFVKTIKTKAGTNDGDKIEEEKKCDDNDKDEFFFGAVRFCCFWFRKYAI